MARSQRAVNWQDSAGMQESCKTNPICWAPPAGQRRMNCAVRFRATLTLGRGWMHGCRAALGQLLRMTGQGGCMC